MKPSTRQQPTPLEWCASCDRYIRGTLLSHIDFHVGRSVDQARHDIEFLRRTKVAA